MQMVCSNFGPIAKEPECEADHLPVTDAKVVSPLPIITSWHAQRQLAISGTLYETELLTPWNRVLLEKLTSKLCS